MPENSWNHQKSKCLAAPQGHFLWSAAEYLPAANKKPAESGVFCHGRNLILQLDNLGGCRTFRTVNNLECYPSALLEGFEAFCLDCGVVNENICSTILLDKTKTL